MRQWRIGVDIGGTFTDLCLVGDDGSVHLWKEDTTPHRREEAIELGLERLAEQQGMELEALLAGCSLFVHGSTVATNTLIERDGPRLGLVCTEGFRDSLYLRDGFKWERYNPRLPHPRDLVDRRLRLGVRERVTSDGAVRTALEEESVRSVARRFAQEGVEAVAVALLWAHVNPVHELRVRELLAEELPGVPVLLSADVLPEVGEWRRTSATVLAAYVQPGISAYLQRLEAWLSERGLKRQLQVMQINGGCASVEEVRRVPVSMIASGPAAAPAAAVYLGAQQEARDVISIDMGGTSLDVCLIRGGEVPRSRTVMVDDQPIGVPAVEIHSIGAGGGSIASVDAGGALHVGPRSAGSTPGPVVYGRGGVEPTVTDANAILGYLSPETFLGGRRRLRVDLAAESMRRHVAEPLGLRDEVEAAAGVLAIVNENMAGAIRAVSVERGLDPRGFLLLAGGGAGALHAGRLARALGMERVLVPSEAGTLSAFGMTVSDVRHDYAATLHMSTAAPDLDRLRELLAGLEQRAREDLERSGLAPAAISISRSVDARYAGQIHELITPVPDGPVDAQAIARTAEAFHAAHRERYTFALPERALECLHWRVAGIGTIARPLAEDGEPPAPRPAPAPRHGVHPVHFAELGGFVETPRHAAADLVDGVELSGPAVVDSPTTTIVVLPGQRLSADRRGHVLITEESSSGAEGPAARAAGHVEVAAALGPRAEEV